MTDTVDTKGCTRDSWLEGIIGRPVYHVRTTDSLQSKNLEDEIRQLQKQRVFLFAKLPVADVASAKKLQDLGFYIVDTSVIFEKSSGFDRSRTLIKGVRPAQLRDENAAVEIARRSFKFSRFHLDPHIPGETADSIKAEWVRNFFKGKRGDELIVVDEDGLKGFCLMFIQAGRIIIDLIAVDERAANKGLGTAMLQYIEGRYRGIDSITVGTQIANVPSQRLYEKNGYRLKEASYVFHYFN